MVISFPISETSDKFHRESVDEGYQGGRSGGALTPRSMSTASVPMC